MSDAVELQKLRMSLIRIAQALDIPLKEFPPAIRPQSFAIDHLVEVHNRPRGWNALAAIIVGRIIERKEEHRGRLDQLKYQLEQWDDTSQ